MDISASESTDQTSPPSPTPMVVRVDPSSPSTEERRNGADRPNTTLRRSAPFLHAIQSKPLVVEGGLNGIRSRDSARFNRTAIGITAENRIIVIGAFHSFGQALTLWEFGHAITSLPKLGGPRIVTALALDGGPGAHIYIPGMRFS